MFNFKPVEAFRKLLFKGGKVKKAVKKKVK